MWRRPQGSADRRRRQLEACAPAASADGYWNIRECEAVTAITDQALPAAADSARRSTGPAEGIRFPLPGPFRIAAAFAGATAAANIANIRIWNRRT